MSSVLHRLADQLFDFDRHETRGEVVFFTLFEAVVLGILLYQLWSWAFYIQTISDVVLPLGLANYLDVTFMFDSVWPFVNAVALTGLLLAGYGRLHRGAYAIAFGLLLLQYAARYTLGEISHGTNLTAMVLLAYLDVTFMFDSVWPFVNAVALTGLLLAGYGRLHRGAYAIAFGLLLLQYAARYTLGEISHGTNLTAMVLLALAIAALAFRRGRARRRFVLGFAYFYTGLAYTLAAWSKLIGTGPHWIDGRHLWLWLHEKAIDTLALQGQHSFNLLQDLAFSHYYLASLFLLAGVLTEFFAWLFWLKPTRLYAGLALLGMHAGIFLMLHITFWMNVVLLVLLTLPWARWIDPWVQYADGQPVRARVG
jgi:hypothetical protein